MLTNLLQIAFFNQYIISPTTWIHNLSSNLKVIIIVTYLSTIPYLNYQYIIITTIFYFIVILNSKIPKSYYINIERTLYIIFICFASNYINFFNTNKHNIYNKYKHNSHVSRSTYMNITTCTIKTIISIIPKYLIRSINIYIIYIAVLKTLYLTTKYEYIIKYCSLNTIYKNQKFHFIYNQHIILLGYQFIILLIHSIMISIKSINLRGSWSSNMYYYVLYNLLYMIHQYTKIVSSTIYFRELVELNDYLYRI